MKNISIKGLLKIKRDTSWLVDDSLGAVIISNLYVAINKTSNIYSKIDRIERRYKQVHDHSKRF